MKKTLLVFFIFCLFTGPVLFGIDSTKTDEKAIKAAVMDYLEGWYQGNAEGMDRALHEKLAKRNLRKKPGGNEELFIHLTKEQMVEFTGKGGGKKIPADKRGIKITILDKYLNAASVKAESLLFIDYVHLFKTKGKWKIINVLWENKPKKQKAK